MVGIVHMKVLNYMPIYTLGLLVILCISLASLETETRGPGLGLDDSISQAANNTCSLSVATSASVLHC